MHVEFLFLWCLHTHIEDSKISEVDSNLLIKTTAPKLHICDAIKQNEPELEKKQKTNFSLSLYVTISELYHVENPVKIEHSVPEI